MSYSRCFVLVAGLGISLALRAAAHAGPVTRGEIQLAFGDEVISTIERSGMRLTGVENAVAELHAERAGRLVIYGFEQQNAVRDFLSWARSRATARGSAEFTLTLRLFDAAGEVDSAVLARGGAALRELRLGLFSRWLNREFWRGLFPRGSACRSGLTPD